MRKILLLILIFIKALAFSQSDIRLNNYWRNPHFVNPATIYDKYLAVFQVAGRKQWLGMTGSPTSFYASGTTFLTPIQAQFGAIITQDKIGYVSSTDIDLQYAYQVELRHDWRMNLGLAGSFQMVSYDLSKVVLDDPNDQNAYAQLTPHNNVNARLGIELTNYEYKFGLSAKNLISLFNKEHELYPSTNYAYAKYRQNNSSLVNFGVGLSAIQYDRFLQSELNVMSYFKSPATMGLVNNDDTFEFGGYYRTRGEVGLIFGFLINSSWHVSYSYDYHFGSISRASYGTNEIILTYNLSKRTTCKSCWY